jgi:hypothetical protein
MRANVVVMAIWSLIACSSNGSTLMDVDAEADGRVPNASAESAVDAALDEAEAPDPGDASAPGNVGSDQDARGPGEAHGDLGVGIGISDAHDDVPTSVDAAESPTASDAASSDAQDAGLQCAGHGVCPAPEICCFIGLGADCRTQDQCPTILF